MTTIRDRVALVAQGRAASQIVDAVRLYGRAV
jgi:hypothetical protein